MSSSMEVAAQDGVGSRDARVVRWKGVVKVTMGRATENQVRFRLTRFVFLAYLSVLATNAAVVLKAHSQRNTTETFDSHLYQR